MKKFIRALADAFGVTDQIRLETRKELGNEMILNHYWFAKDSSEARAVHYIGVHLLEHGHCDPARMREEIKHPESQWMINLVKP